MAAKRALVVDDSRSARAFLARILERHNLDVDGAESAEAALEYLKKTRPDVIFMDHLMPGMDGFQAVQLIKKDPRTAMIPILMYTSQEGELYLSQARALGALGVLPKQTRPVDVEKALLQLHLLESEPDSDLVSATPLSATSSSAGVPADIRELVSLMLRDEGGEMRRFVQESLDTHRGLVEEQVRDLLERGVAAPGAPSRRRQVVNGVLISLTVVGATVALALAYVWYQAADQQRALGTRMQELESQLSSATRQLEQAQADAHPSVVAGVPEVGPVFSYPVSFGEVALSGARVELIRAQLEKTLAANFRGKIEIRLIPGRFCVSSGVGEALALAEAESLRSKCSELSDQQLAAMTGERESVAFANMLSAIRARAGTAVQFQTASGNVNEVLVAYPPLDEKLTAGAWNDVAAKNYRVELRLIAETP
jgi:CheY-like chemotaxis protein